MEKKKEILKNKLEREYIIPLRKKYSHVPKHKRTPRAVKTVKNFLIRHFKIYDKDPKKIKLDKYLNEFLWFRGIKNPPAKVKVKAIKEEGIVKVELVELPEKLRFKKIREGRIIEKAEKSKKKKPIEKPIEEEKSGQIKEEEKVERERKTEQTEEERKVEEEKTKAGEEAMRKLEKKQAKQIKHQTEAKKRQPKRKQRKALNK
jgi:large subunit ribosomal protein L31e